MYREIPMFLWWHPHTLTNKNELKLTARDRHTLPIPRTFRARFNENIIAYMKLSEYFRNIYQFQKSNNVCTVSLN